MNATSFVSKYMCLKREWKVCHVSSFTHPHVIRNIKNDLHMEDLYRCPKNPKMFCEGRHMDETFTLIMSRLMETYPVNLCVCCFSGLKMMRKGLFSVLLIESGANCPCNANQFRQSQVGQKERPIFLLLISWGCVYMGGWVKVCVQMCTNIYVCLHIYISVCESTESKCKTPKEFSWEFQYRCLISKPSSCAVDMFVIFILNFTFHKLTCLFSLNG